MTLPRNFGVKLTLLIVIMLAIAGFYIFSDPEIEILCEESRGLLPGQFVKLDQGYTHYQLMGSAKASVVVLVHDFAEPYYVWDNNYSTLIDAGFNVLRYDLYGRGFSDRPVTNYDVTLFEQQLQQLLQQLKINKPVHLIGVGMGAAIVANYATQHPHNVKSIVLIDAAGFTSKISKLAQMEKLPILGNIILRIYGDKKMLPDGNEFYDAARFPGWSAKFAAQTRYWGFEDATLSMLRHFPNTGMQATYEQLGELKIPTLLLWGEGDKILPFAMHQLVLQALQNATFIPIAKAGHLANYERPEIVNPVLIKFLRQTA